ncbi:ankyrin [Morchella conica CCBAS932]|uniref:Ankyrin n=1 Tax=Morchella conica CCBAS932 TaxID=1392247 RepID=A0A3N4KP82_9PEZI|nr:ankyrin [Morchella conica CCBAS932]
MSSSSSSSLLLDLPTELLLKIARHLTLRALTRLVRANHLCNDLLTPLLYERPIRDVNGHLPIIFWATMLGNTPLVSRILDRTPADTINMYSHPDPGERLPDCMHTDPHHRMHFYRSWLLAKCAVRHHPCQNLLQWAVCCHRLEIVELLLQRGARINPEPHRWCAAPRGSEPAGTALHYAVGYSKYLTAYPPEEIVGALLDHGADRDVGDAEGDNALQAHLKSRQPSDVIVRKMLDHGYDANGVGNDGHTPLWTAVDGAKLFSEGVVGLLVERGADTGVRVFGESILHRVVARLGREAGMGVSMGMGTGAGWWSALRYFLQYADDVNVRDSCNQSLLHYAVAKMHMRCLPALRLLVESGVDHRLKDIFGRTALDLAVGVGGDDAVVFLQGLCAPVQSIELLDSNMQGLSIPSGGESV